jgi:hypothetical protein
MSRFHKYVDETCLGAYMSKADKKKKKKKTDESELNESRSKIQRMWVNQPSTLQPYNKLHGTNVLANFSDMVGDKVTVYFLKGNTVSQLIDKIALSKGWK